MIEFSYHVEVENGMHARPAGKMVKAAAGFDSDINIVTAEGATASAKKLFAVMKLGVKQGDTVTVTVDGSDESAAADFLKTFMSENF